MHKEQEWSEIISPRNKLLDIDLREIWRYRDLLALFVKRDIITQYKQTILGPLWYVVQPAITVLMYMVVFGGIAGIPTDGVAQPLFYLAGVCMWQYFADCLNSTSNTFVKNAGMVRDDNCDFKNSFGYEWVVPTMKKIYGMNVENEELYYNGGVAFVRDCAMTHEFYKRWHENWIYSMRNFNKLKDQQPLMKVNIDMGYVVTEMSGNLNCQVAVSIKYLHTAHVVHFFNTIRGKYEDMSPFFKEAFVIVKENGITDNLKEVILNCKSSFMSPSMPVPREGAMLWRKHLSESGKHEEMIQASNTYHALLFMWLRLPRFTRFIDKILGKFIRKSHKKK